MTELLMAGQNTMLCKNKHVLWQVWNLSIQTVGHEMHDEKPKIKTLKSGELKFDAS